MPVKIVLLVDDKAAAARIKKFAKNAGADVKKLEKQSVTSSKKMSSAFSGIGGSLGALGIGLGVGVAVTGLKKLIGAASDTEESLNKVREVFGSAAVSVETFSKTAAESIGASRQEALAMTGELGNLLVAFGFTEAKAADMSTEMVQLAADLGSFNNVKTVDALNAIRSALVGEAEPMKRFGSDVRQVRLDQVALANGIEFTKGKMDSQTKALAAMKTIMMDTKKAQGDFKRTSDGLANSSKIMESNFKDLASELGEQLIPVAKLAVKSLTLIAKGVKDVVQGFSSGETLDIAKSFGMKEWLAATVLAIDGTNEWAFQTVIASEKARAAVKEATEDQITQWAKVFDFTANKDAGGGQPPPEDPALKRDLAMRMEILASLKLQADKQRILNQLTLEGLIPLNIRLTKAGEIKKIEGESIIIKAIANEKEREAVALKSLLVGESQVQLQAQLILNDAVHSMADGIGRAVVEGEKLTDIFGQIAKQLISRGIAGLITGGYSEFAGGSFGTGFGKAFGFAGGGRPPTGRPSIVGERGPEMFIPDQPGTIVPNNKITNNMGGINLSFPNVRGKIDQRTVRAEVIPLLQSVLRQHGARLT